uniref:Uncharacterized protein n=1 Tax=Ovis aries TaxID=9940 RepID=A0AC11DD06_SHEEP
MYKSTLCYLLSYEEQLLVATQSPLLNHIVSSSMSCLLPQGQSKKLKGILKNICCYCCSVAKSCPWTAACQVPLSSTLSWSLCKFMSIDLVMLSSHFILCYPFLLLPSTFPSIRIFSSESALCIRWPKYWSFSFSISPSNEYSGLNIYSGAGALQGRELKFILTLGLLFPDVPGLANPEESQLRLILVGKTGAGKSAAGNSILREKVFPSSFSAVSITKHCKKGSSTWKGREVVVVDTPGLFDTEVSDAETLKEITCCMVLTSPGPHALLLVIPLGRYTPEGQKATEKILAMFGERAREHMILLFTRKDDLDGMDFHDYLKQAPRAIQELIRKFRGRYCVFNNKATGAEQEDQREQLLALVQDMVDKCKGRYYTNSLYQKIEEEIQKETQVLQENFRAELEREIAQIIQKFEEDIRKPKDELEQQEWKVEMERQLAEREAHWVSRQQTARDDVLSQSKILEIIFNMLRFFSSLFKD